MSKVTVDAGCCGIKAVVHAKKTGDTSVRIRISSDCEMLTNMNPELTEVSWREGVFGRISDCKIYEISSRHIEHTACPMPAAILKAIEVETGLAAPVDVTMTFDANDGD
jgi:hypothetical protein